MEKSLIVQKKQEELKTWLKKIGWSQKRFARSYYYDFNDTDIEEEVLQFEEKFKKQISRKTTSVELVDQYLKYLYSLKEVKLNSFISCNNSSEDEFGNIFNLKMRDISRRISNIVEDENIDITKHLTRTR